MVRDRGLLFMVDVLELLCGATCCLFVYRFIASPALPDLNAITGARLLLDIPAPI